MSFDYRAYVEKFMKEPGNRAQGYGVELVPFNPSPEPVEGLRPEPVEGLRPEPVEGNKAGNEVTWWRCLGVWHLLPGENEGKHHVYCEVLDEAGQRLTGATILILNHEGGVRGRMTVDKPLNEPGTNTHIHSNETLGLLVEGLPGDRVLGLHTRHPDEPVGNSWGHHSYFVLFQRSRGAASPQPSPPGEEVPAPAPGPDEGWLKQVDEAMARLKQLAGEWEAFRKG